MTLNENSQLEAKVQQLESELQNQVGEREGVGKRRGGEERRGEGRRGGGRRRCGEEGRKGGKGKWRITYTHAHAFLQLKAHKRGIEETEVTINMLLKRQNEDKVHSLTCSHHTPRLPPQPLSQCEKHGEVQVTETVVEAWG